MPTAERRARAWTDTARLWHALGNGQEAFAALRLVEQEAAQEVRRPALRALTSNLFYSPARCMACGSSRSARGPSPHKRPGAAPASRCWFGARSRCRSEPCLRLVLLDQRDEFPHPLAHRWQGFNGTIIEAGTESYRLAQNRPSSSAARKTHGDRRRRGEAGGIVSPGDQQLSTALQNADSPDWSVRAAVGPWLAASDKLDEVADILHRLLLDLRDSAVTQETAEALLARRDTAGLPCVLLASSQAVEFWTMDQLGDALDSNSEWMTTDGADRLIQQLHELAADDDAGVRDEAQRILSRLPPHEEWVRRSDDGPL